MPAAGLVFLSPSHAQITVLVPVHQCDLLITEACNRPKLWLTERSMPSLSRRQDEQTCRVSCSYSTHLRKELLMLHGKDTT